jgi:hypothetical protein
VAAAGSHARPQRDRATELLCLCRQSTPYVVDTMDLAYASWAAAEAAGLLLLFFAFYCWGEISESYHRNEQLHVTTSCVRIHRHLCKR